MMKNANKDDINQYEILDAAELAEISGLEDQKSIQPL